MYTVIEMVTELKLLDIVMETKLSFKGYIRMTAAFASSKFKIMRRASRLFGEQILVFTCVLSF